MNERAPERDEATFPVRGVDPDRLFLDEVARLLPDVDVVAVTAPQRSGAPEPTEAAAAERLTAARQLAIDELATAWRAAFPHAAPPEVVTTTWRQAQFVDAVAAEAMVRAGGLSAEASASIDTIELALASAGWTCTRRDPSGDGNHRIVGLDDDDRALVDLVVRRSADVVLLRVRTADVAVGARASELLYAPASSAPLPSPRPSST